MGLLKAAIIFIVGTFFLSIIDKHLDKVNDLPIVGDVFGESMKKYIQKNKCMSLLILITGVEFIL
jgi:hypothetical protein